MSHHHLKLLPKSLDLFQAQQVLQNHFSEGNPLQPPVLIGVDEAGRGPLAGPVVAAAVVLGEYCNGGQGLPLQDSKKLTETQRERIFEELPSYCKHFSIAEASTREIDELGILNATFLAMRRSLEPIISQALEFRILVDGNLYIRELDPSIQMPLIKGDGRVACIAAASIFAKVHRDRLMRKFAEQYPQYGFEKHKGYGTKTHLAAIEKHGLCELHRRTYAPISRLIP